MNTGSDEELFANFLSESSEFLELLEKNALSLEKAPESRELVDNIFRAVHSLKGNCSLFGLSGVKLFTHSLENLMGKIRDSELVVNTEIINLILRGSDLLNAIFSRLETERENIAILPEEQEYMDSINSIIEGNQCDERKEKLRIEIMKFINRSDIHEELKLNHTLREFFEIIQRTSPDLLLDKRRDKMPRASVFYDGLDVTREYSSIKAIISEAKQGNSAENHPSIIFNSLDSLIEKHEKAALHGPLPQLMELKEDLEMMYHDESGFDDVLIQILEDAMALYAENLQEKKMEMPKTVPEKPEALQLRQIRIDQRKLDKAINTVGELVTVSELFNYLQSQFNEGKVETNLTSLKDAIISLQEMSETLSCDLYDIRKVPISEAFQKLPRIVRDESLMMKKKARLLIEGENTFVDKSLIHPLETILVHMIRNSTDHGIEHPVERIQKEKPEEGTIHLTAKASETYLFISVSDDGRGIDSATLKEKAVAKGLLDPSQAEIFSDKQMIEQIFAPGFSTSERITETSGRGVGMDVVHSKIMELEGNIEIHNSPGSGITFVLKIPLTHTTLVKKGLAVAVGRNVFLIPIESVMESFRPSREEISTMKGETEIVRRRNEIIPLIRLHKMLNIETRIQRPEESLLVMTQHKNRKVCIMVDFVIGQRQIIYKQLGIKTVLHPSPFEGVSVYDGNRLAMILDIGGIAEQMTMQ